MKIPKKIQASKKEGEQTNRCRPAGSWGKTCCRSMYSKSTLYVCMYVCMYFSDCKDRGMR